MFGPELVAGGVTLRAPGAGDVDARVELGVTGAIERMFGVMDAVDRAMSRDAAERWYAALGAGDVVEWVVEVDGSFLGTARLHSFSEARSRARYAVGFLDPRQLGQGIGQVVTRLVVEHGFAELGLSEIELVVLDFNERAQRCYAACGFEEVARTPTDIVSEGRATDDILMVVTSSSFKR